MARNTKKHPQSVSATELSKLGQCELLVAFDLADAANAEMAAASDRGNKLHDRFHRRAVLNAGTSSLARQL